jgi:hypothetical protein
VNVRSVAGINRDEGIGVAEAPRGTLLHHYRVDGDGIVQWANLVIATGHNNLAMNHSVAQVARHYVKVDRLTEAMLNRVEAVIRRYDPCLSCSTHVIGQMPLHVSLLAPGGAASPRPRHPGRPGRGPLRPRPPVVLVAVAAASPEAGDRLSPALERALPEVEVVLRVAARYRLTAATREGRRGGAGPGGG